MPRSACTVALETYHGAFTIILRIFDLSSDHTPIIATISSSVTIRHNTVRLHNYKTKWEKYREEITNNINLKIKLKTQENLELAIETLTKAMQQAATQSTPTMSMWRICSRQCNTNTILYIPFPVTICFSVPAVEDGAGLLPHGH
jgi:hypothetical protein